MIMLLLFYYILNKADSLINCHKNPEWHKIILTTFDFPLTQLKWPIAHYQEIIVSSQMLIFGSNIFFTNRVQNTAEISEIVLCWRFPPMLALSFLRSHKESRKMKTSEYSWKHIGERFQKRGEKLANVSFASTPTYFHVKTNIFPYIS